MSTPASPETRRYRGAVIGAGGTARQSHLPALLTAAGLRDRVEIVAVVDSAADLPPVDGLPAAVPAWTGRLRHRSWEVEDTASLHFEYPERLVTMFFTWAARRRENRIRFVGERGAIEWVGGELRLERDGTLERYDYSAELDKTAYQRWFAGLFESFVASLDRGDPARAAAPYIDDIRRVATAVEHAYAAAQRGCRVAIPPGG